MAVVCTLVLVGISVWIIHPSQSESSTIGRWLHERIVGPSRVHYVVPNKLCIVTRVDGTVRIFADGSLFIDEVSFANKEHLYLYKLTGEPNGFFAPTSMNIRHTLKLMYQHGTVWSHQFFAFSRRWELGLDPDEEGVLAVPLTLSVHNEFVETKRIWSGYAVNLAAVLAYCGFVWSLLWVPRQIIHLVRRKRYLRGLCPFCRYDVRATPDQCPECGWGHEGEADKDSAG